GVGAFGHRTDLKKLQVGRVRIKLPDGVEDGVHRTIALRGAGAQLRAHTQSQLRGRNDVLAGRDFQRFHLDRVLPAQHGIVYQRDDIGIEYVFFLVGQVLETPERILQRVWPKHITERRQLIVEGMRSLRTLIAITISSRAAFPARSPMPLIVHSTWRAPARTPASELATARPRSLWQCVEKTTRSAPGTRVFSIRISSKYSCGVA